MVIRTRTAIVEAFNKLIEKEDFESITVAAIIEKADVSKATFYRYFKDKYDVMNYNYKILLDDAVGLRSISNYRDLYCQLYRLGETKLRTISGAFKSKGVNSFAYYIYHYSRDTVVEITRLNRGGAGLTEGENIQLDVFCYGIGHMYEKWVNDKYRISPEDAADRLFEIMPLTLRDYWFPHSI